ncbi:MAG TPA: hypothetical protein VKA43_11560 [Gammaproteobacteria bacterium]|nr:hypothetical protein [Gammaproteobacteria bacterium]
MKRLRIVLAGILLTMPLFALNASTSVDEGGAVELQQTPRLTGYCWVNYNGQWYQVPC